MFITEGYVTPARLPFSDDRSLVGEEVTLSGWGNYSATGVRYKRI